MSNFDVCEVECAQMNDHKTEKIDFLIMLLSTDWFLEFWPLIGIGVPKPKKSQLQLGCRPIVTQIHTVSGSEVKDRIDISHTPERLLETRNQFLTLLASCDLDEPTRIAVLSGLQRKRYSKTQVIVFEDITKLLVENYFDDVEPKLDPLIKQAVAEAWKYTQSLASEEPFSPFDEVDLNHLNLESDTPWDRYIRSLTPDIPDNLANWIYGDVTTVPALECSWCLVGENVKAYQKKELLDWYLATATNTTGAQMNLPFLSVCVQPVPS
ncbi:MAG: hypothetical protein C0507_19875 [Cyanobacteria bacterium PR.3.49]|nr:hypothetical protein [Cyanobacteria bacterium PR.3.49]